MNKGRIAKYLGFDALKGLKEEIEAENIKKCKAHRVQLSEDQLDEMNLVLLKSYRRKSELLIKVYNKGRIEEVTGIIDKIDIIEKYIILTSKKRISFSSIQELIEKNNGWD